MKKRVGDENLDQGKRRAQDKISINSEGGLCRFLSLNLLCLFKFFILWLMMCVGLFVAAQGGMSNEHRGYDSGIEIHCSIPRVR